MAMEINLEIDLEIRAHESSLSINDDDGATHTTHKTRTLSHITLKQQ